MRQEQIHFDITLDENNVPEKLTWAASENQRESEVKALIISVWDKKDQHAMRIDLWNKEMQVDEMKQFVHQTILTLSDSFERATGEKAMAETMRDFCEYYAEKMNIRAPL